MPDSHLLRLPRELRDKIYSAVFDDSTVVLPNYRNGKLKPTPEAIGLLLACKQIFTEAIDLYYRITTFVLPFRYYCWKPAERWLDALPDEYRAKITRIEVIASVEDISHMMRSHPTSEASAERRIIKRNRNRLIPRLILPAGVLRFDRVG